MTSWIDAKDQNRYYYAIQELLHSLHGGDALAVAGRRACLERLLREGIGVMKDWESGLIAHALGDSFAHIYLKDGMLRAFPRLRGHGVESKLGTDPDVISNNPATYSDYVDSLNRAFGSRMSAEARRKLTTSMSIRHANQDEAIAAARRIAISDFGYSEAYDPAGGKRIGSLGKVTELQVRSLLEKIRNACCEGE
jgi:hypothetical protein